MKYVLKEEAKVFLRRVISNKYRYEEVCRKAEAIFNSEQDYCRFEIDRFSNDESGMGIWDCSATVYLQRKSACEEVKEPWELTDEEINGINDSEKAAA